MREDASLWTREGGAYPPPGSDTLRVPFARTTYAVDLPGHGGSSKDVGEGGVQAMSEALLDLMHHLKVHRAHLVGHSMGGMMAQMVAIDHPARVRSLGLLSTIPGRDPRYILHGERPELMQQPARYTRDEVVAGARALASATASHRYPLDVEWNAWAAGEAYDRGYAPEGFSRQWSALLRAPERLEALRSVDVPAFVFHGRDDDVLHWSAAVDMAEALPHAELQVHPDLGHYLNAEFWPALVDGIVRTVERG